MLLSEAQIKIFFLRRKFMFCSQGIQVFVFLTITWFTMSVISIWILLVQETGYVFDSHLIKSPGLANWWIKRIIIFRNLLKNLTDWGKVPGPCEFSNLLQSLSNQWCQDYHKIIKRSETIFQSPALKQKHVTNVCHAAH